MIVNDIFIRKVPDGEYVPPDDCEYQVFVMYEDGTGENYFIGVLTGPISETWSEYHIDNLADVLPESIRPVLEELDLPVTTRDLNIILYRHRGKLS